MYHSQIGQDKYIDEEIFNKKESGFFIDIGAGDGERFSNTLFFEKERKWKGICIEPLPFIFNELIKNRKSICIQSAISNYEKKNEEFTIIKTISYGLSGLTNKYDPRHLRRIESDVKLYNGYKDTIKVDVYSLQKILNDYTISNIDFCSIDVEGAELSVLQSINFSKIKIKCFCIENNFADKEVESFLSKKKYKLVKKIEWDDVYVIH